MKNSKTKIIKYFGFGTNRDLDMMAHMIGRKDIVGELGRLLGYELCIQRGKQFRDEIPKTSPLKISPRTLIVRSWGPEFKMYVSRPNPDGIIYGTIWDITPEELELVREWEMVDYGAQEDAKGMAVNSSGEIIEVITQSFLSPPLPEIEQVITGDDYEPYIESKEAMLKKADEVRFQYVALKKKTSK